MNKEIIRVRESTGETFWLEKVLPTIHFLQTELKNAPQGSIALSYNGGKDCTVLLQLLEISGFFQLYDIKILYFVQEDCFEQLQEFINDRIRSYEDRVLRLSSNIKKEMEILVKQRGIQQVILGQRVGDPYCPPSEKEPSTPGWPHFMRLCPILNWSYVDVWHFLRSIRARYCCLYDRGYSSLGPKSRTQVNPRLVNKPAYLLDEEATERLGRN